MSVMLRSGIHRYTKKKDESNAKKKKVYMNCLNVTKGVLLINETGVKA